MVPFLRNFGDIRLFSFSTIISSRWDLTETPNYYTKYRITKSAMFHPQIQIAISRGQDIYILLVNPF